MSFQKKWFPLRVVSSDGYSIQFTDRAAITYKDDRLTVYVSAEKLVPTHTWAINPEDMRVGSISGEQLKDPLYRSLIVERIRAVFDFLKWKLED